MTGPAVLGQKVRPPPPSGLRRARLLDPLVGPGSPRVGVLVTPAGCGKTTLMAQAAAAFDGAVGWYRAEAADASEDALVRHVARALPPLRAGGAAVVDDLLTGLEGAADRPLLLVVDDVHEIAGTPAERALGRLLALAPPELRVLLGSRRRPASNLSRMEVAGRVHSVGEPDLRFRTAEVDRLFDDVHGDPLPPGSAAELTERTGGWAAALQLFHLATAGRGAAERRRAIGSLCGRNRLVAAYLDENVLAPLRPDQRAFLVRTASLRLLTGELCDALLGTSGSQAVLLELEAAGAFTTSDDGGVTFRHHRVLQDHLEVALEDGLGGATRAWYRRSASLLEDAGHRAEAVRASIRAEEGHAARTPPVPRREEGGVRLQLLGDFRLEVDGRAVPWAGVRPKVLTLLRLLCLSLGTDVHRETLIEALWPETPSDVGTHRLQVAVSSLRRALDAAGLTGSVSLERRGEAYRLRLPPGAAVDVRELEQELATAAAAWDRGAVELAGAAARRALLLYRGDLLPGDGPAEWAVDVRGRLRRQVADLARRLAEDCLTGGDLRTGVAAARRSLELDRFQDAVWSLLAVAYDRAGEPAAAEHARLQRARALADLTRPAWEGTSRARPVLGVVR